MGERLTTLADPQALRAATVLLLLSPFIPLLFMGEEVASQTPFLFFTDHNDELAELVREGRRAEFKHFAAFQDPERREKIPDPNAPAPSRPRSRTSPATAASSRTAGGAARAHRARHPRLPQRGRGGAGQVGAGRALAARHRRDARIASISATRSRLPLRMATRSSRARRHLGRGDDGCLLERSAVAWIEPRSEPARPGRSGGPRPAVEGRPRPMARCGRRHAARRAGRARAAGRTDADVADSLHRCSSPASCRRWSPAMRRHAHLPVAAGAYEFALETAPAVGHGDGDRRRSPLPAVPGYHTLRIGGAEVDARGRAGHGAGPWRTRRRAARGGLPRSSTRCGGRAMAGSAISAAWRTSCATPPRMAPRPSRSARSTRSSPPRRTGSAPTRRPAAPAERAACQARPDGRRRRRARGAGPGRLARRDGLRLRSWTRCSAGGAAGRCGTSSSASARRRRRAGGPCAVRGAARGDARDGGPWHWRNWPDGLSDADSPAVAAFATEHAARSRGTPSTNSSPTAAWPRRKRPPSRPGWRSA